MALGSIIPPMEDCEIFTKQQRSNLFTAEPELNGDSDSECSRASESQSDTDEAGSDNEKALTPKSNNGSEPEVDHNNS